MNNPPGVSPINGLSLSDHVVLIHQSLGFGIKSTGNGCLPLYLLFTF